MNSQFTISPGTDSAAVISLLSDWLFALGFGEDAPDLAHRVYTRCLRMFGEGEYRLNGDDLERLGKAWGTVVASNEVERFVYATDENEDRWQA